ncbi:hypothetical protein MCBMB27_02660 [Methylobacterium phyllosphaerae]|uniref:Uncharacterized protein n=1 Tax=Methylobacterium phyllosphaerae TaxID=418223 RepID=A0AAE8HSG1_9HYPH|nr:hypothetical protein [Methylobacterium phyllosphaerae]APT31951.1 hypothetical protein MCBMB27_02660 [Methylobacterium phyllosphaerae]SFH01024.1 hypothetical protein SAMN05192567_1127 [Methylobacterium phyllosphaerae]
MAFVCTVSENDLNVEIFKRGDASLSVLPIGYNDDLGTVYSMAVGFEPLPGGDTEFFFHVVEAHPEMDEEHIYWSGRETRFISDPEDRKAILAAMLYLTQGLLRSSQPETVRWFTHDEDPPDKALVKHFLIANVFDVNGYSVITPDPYHGRRVWLAERRAG